MPPEPNTLTIFSLTWSATSANDGSAAARAGRTARASAGIIQCKRVFIAVSPGASLGLLERERHLLQVAVDGVAVADDEPPGQRAGPVLLVVEQADLARVA